jgi:hypothetical protein
MKSPSASRKAQVTHLKALAQKQIAGTVIFSRFVHCLGLPPNVDLTKPVPLGGNLTNWDLGLDLMRYAPFRHDGLILQKPDCLKAATAGALCNLIYDWYKADGWTIT